MGNSSEAPSGVWAEHATVKVLEGCFVGVSAFSLRDDATPRLRARVTAIRRRLLIKQVAHFLRCFYCGRPSVAVQVETVFSAYPFCEAHVPFQFRTKGVVDYNKSVAAWCGSGGHFGLMKIEEYLRCLCGPFRTDPDGQYYRGSNFFRVGDGVYVGLAGDGAVTSQGVNTSPIISSRAPLELTEDELYAWCTKEIDRLIELIISEAR